MKIPKILFKKKSPQSGVYCIENTKNGKLYIGSSKNMYQRLHIHRCYLNNNSHQNQKLQNSWNKYGEDNFICYSLEQCNFEELTSREQYYINNLKPWYNITLLVERNILSLESRKKISNTLKDGYKTKRIKLTKFKSIKVYNFKNEYLNRFETIKDACKYYNLHQSSVQRVLNNTYKQCKGLRFKYENDSSELEIVYFNKGGKASSIRKPFNKRSKELIIKDLETNYIYNFKSIKEASIELNLKYEIISQFLRNKIKIYKNKYQLLPVPVKSDKLLENPEEDNQQPITTLNE